MSLYIFSLLFSFLASIASIFVILFLQKKYVFFQNNRQESGRGHKKNISRWGGVTVGIVFLTTLFLDPFLRITPDIWGLIAGCLGMLFLGIRDDVKPLHWRWQIFFQGGVVALIILLFHVSITDFPNPFGGRIFFEGGWGSILGSLVACIWFLVVINALNWIDGVDGVAPGIVVLSALALFSVSVRLEVSQPPVAIISLALLGSYLGLFLFNVYPAKILSGTAGVFLAGFVIAYLSIFAGTKMATALLVLGMPILDTFWVLWKRFRLGEALAHPDKKHLHYQLLTLGWSERRVSFFLLGIMTLATSVTFLFGPVGKFFSACFLVGIFCVLIRMKKEK